MLFFFSPRLKLFAPVCTARAPGSRCECWEAGREWPGRAALWLLVRGDTRLSSSQYLLSRGSAVLCSAGSAADWPAGGGNGPDWGTAAQPRNANSWDVSGVKGDIEHLHSITYILDIDSKRGVVSTFWIVCMFLVLSLLHTTLKVLSWWTLLRKVARQQRSKIYASFPYLTHRQD